MRIPFLLFAALIMGYPGTTDAEIRKADLVVYGATPGGFCAAIAAAREGASVILVEPTGHIGGVNTGGLSFSDSNQTVRSTVMGLFDEWHRRIESDYRARGIALPYQVNVKDQTHWTYEPHVAMRVTLAMLDEAGVEVLKQRVLRSVMKTGNRITALAAGDDTFEARVFIDATYEGDLMAAAGVGWTIGRESRAQYGESLAGKTYPKKKMAISGFDQEGELLPLITTADAGPDEAGDKNVMVYSFRLCLTKDPANRVPFPEPDAYDPARFEVVRRYYQNEKMPHLLWDLYPLPGGKFDANNGIGKQVPFGDLDGGDEAAGVGQEAAGIDAGAVGVGGVVGQAPSHQQAGVGQPGVGEAGVVAQQHGVGVIEGRRGEAGPLAGLGEGLGAQHERPPQRGVGCQPLGAGLARGEHLVEGDVHAQAGEAIAVNRS